MKNLKKAALLLLAVLTVTLFSGCGNQADKLVGSWEMSYDMEEVIVEGMGPGYEDFESEFVIDLVFEFNEDGTMKMYADKESIEKSLDAWIDDFVVYGTEMIYEEADAMGVSREEQDEAIQSTFGYANVEEYMRSEMNASLSADDLADSILSEGKYKVVGDKLFMATDGEDLDSVGYDTFEIKGDTLTFTTEDGDDEEILPGLDYPFSFTKR